MRPLWTVSNSKPQLKQQRRGGEEGEREKRAGIPLITIQTHQFLFSRYKEDVKLLKELGVKSYRFSLSWPRLFPTGEIDSESEKGVEFYQNLIDLLIENGIKPGL